MYDGLCITVISQTDKTKSTKSFLNGTWSAATSREVINHAAVTLGCSGQGSSVLGWDSGGVRMR